MQKAISELSCTHVPLFQSESRSIAFHMKMSFHSHADQTHFHIKSFARSLALKKRHKTIWKIMASSFKIHVRTFSRKFYSSVSI